MLLRMWFYLWDLFLHLFLKFIGLFLHVHYRYYQSQKKKKSQPTFWTLKLPLYFHLVIHDSKAVGIKLASDLKMKERLTYNQKRKKKKTSTTNSHNCILFKINLSLH